VESKRLEGTHRYFKGTQWKSPFVRPERRGEDNTHIWERSCEEDRRLMEVAHACVKWQALVLTVLKLQAVLPQCMLVNYYATESIYHWQCTLRAAIIKFVLEIFLYPIYVSYRSCTCRSQDLFVVSRGECHIWTGSL
jgi:hypothetical protein